MAIYLIVAVAALLAAGPDRLAHAAAPLAEAVRAAGPPALVPVITVGAALASMGALLALIAGLGRTALAMARHRDLPGWLAAVHPRYHVPHHAEIAIGAVVCVLVSHRRPARDDRLFVVRSVDLLRDRQRRCVYVACVGRRGAS